jgi:hypothetical protein
MRNAFTFSITRVSNHFTVSLLDENEVVRDFRWFTELHEAMAYIADGMNRACYITEEHA